MRHIDSHRGKKRIRLRHLYEALYLFTKLLSEFVEHEQRNAENNNATVAKVSKAYLWEATTPT